MQTGEERKGKVKTTLQCGAEPSSKFYKWKKKKEKSPKLVPWLNVCVLFKCGLIRKGEGPPKKNLLTRITTIPPLWGTL